MESKLKQYFPMIRERDEILSEIRNRRELEEQFDRWNLEQQEEFLNFCTGVRGIKLLYDGFFKEIMNPEYKPERMDDFLSQMLGKRVKVLKVLPTDSTRIADESSLIIMDIVVELEEGSIANVEVQKIGYLFQVREVPAIQQIYCFGSIKEFEVKRKRNSAIVILKQFIRLYCFKKVQRSFKRFPMNIIIFPNRKQTLD